MSKIPCGASIIDTITAMPTARSVRFTRSRYSITASCLVKRAGIADEIRRRSSGNHRRIWRDPERPKGHLKMATKRRRQVLTGLINGLRKRAWIFFAMLQRDGAHGVTLRL